MKLYVVSKHRVLTNNSGFIKLITPVYFDAQNSSEIGDFIHEIDTVDVIDVVGGGKMFIRKGDA